jgi:hypothetical protein
MTCTLVLIAHFWVNPCNIQFVHPWESDAGVKKCVIVMRDGERMATASMNCNEVVAELN